MNDLITRNFEGKDVEILFLDENPLFNPYDVGICLEMPERTVRDHLAKMNDKQKVLLKNADGEFSHIRNFNNAGENFLKEPGLYKLIFKSRAPKAEEFQDWIAEEVLPSIRKTGSYSLDSVVEQQLETTFQGVKILTGVEPQEIARVQNESWRAKLANLINDIAKREQISTKSLYEKLYFLFASETGFHIPELAKEAKVTNSYYLKQHELSAKMLYEFALGYFYKDKRFVELINLSPDQRTLVDFEEES